MSIQINRKDFKRRQPKTAMQKRVRNYYKGGRQLYNDVMALKGMLNVEYKAYTTSISQNVDSTTPQTLLLNVPTRGDDINQRDGRTIRNKSIEIKGFTSMSASASNTRIRVLLVLARHPQGTAPTITDFLVSNSTDSLRQLDHRTDYVILRDWRFHMDINGKRSFPIKYYKKLNFRTVFNSASAGAIGDIDSGALYIFATSSEATNTPILNLNTRVRYIDN